MKLRHVGMVVDKKNFDKTVAFYEMFGFYFSTGKVESGKYIDEFFGIENLEILTYKMKNEFEDCVELIRFENSIPYNEQKGLHYTGLTHVAIQVKNLSEIKEKLIEKGISLVCDTQHPPRGLNRGCKVLFCEDPSGAFVELVEEL